VLAAITEAGAEPWVHSCAPEVPWSLVRGAGALGLSADLDVLRAEDLDALAEGLEAGGSLALGVVPSTDPASVPTDTVITERVLRWLDMVGLDPEEVAGRLVVTPSCGLAGASYDWARQALQLSGVVAGHL
jgi:methionine synthase II (cobalamin-independent)